jgi:superfamily II DNA helicase RecQ
MFKIITIPFDRNKKGFVEEALTKFILNKQVISHHVQFFEDGADKYWSVFLEYDPVLEKAPEKEAEGLDEPQTILLERFRAWRKERAEKDGVPVYIIGTNKELVNIVKTVPASLEALKGIKGFGKAKIQKYGKEIIEIINIFYSKT